MGDRRIRELVLVGLLTALFVLLLLGDKLVSKKFQEPEPLDSGTIYEMQEVPAHTEIPANHNGFLVYDDAYIIRYQKAVDGEPKQEQWYVDKETYEKYKVGDWFDYNEEQEHCHANRAWTRIDGQNENNAAFSAAMAQYSVAAALRSFQSSGGY